VTASDQGIPGGLRGAATDEHVRRWREDGWVLIEDLVPVDEIDAALEDLWRVFPRPEEFHAGGGGARRDGFLGGADPRNLFRTGPADLVLDGGPPADPAFRAEQFLGTALFPFPGSGALNRLTVHDHVVDFAERALGSDDLRLYQMAAWAKYHGVTDYAQPLHQDHNHSVLPPRSEPGWWHLEGFLYLSDVEEGVGPTRLVSVRDSRGRLEVLPQLPAAAPELYEAERPAPGRRGSFLAYRPDVFHRAVDLTRPGGARFLLGLSFKLAGHDWIGYENVQSRSVAGRFVRFVEGCTPRQLALFGVPRPGHPYWNETVLAAMAARYPGLDLTPWRDALAASTPAEDGERA